MYDIVVTYKSLFNFNFAKGHIFSYILNFWGNSNFSNLHLYNKHFNKDLKFIMKTKSKINSLKSFVNV